MSIHWDKIITSTNATSNFLKECYLHKDIVYLMQIDIFGANKKCFSQKHKIPKIFKFVFMKVHKQQETG